MAVLIMLFAAWLVFRGVGASGVSTFATWHDSARYALAVMFVFAAIAHFNKMKYDLARSDLQDEQSATRFAAARLTHPRAQSFLRSRADERLRSQRTPLPAQGMH
jgi:hypothetical protein